MKLEDELTQLTSVQLLDAALWREIGSDEPQLQDAFIEALSRVLARWMLTYSQTPELEVLTALCKTRAYICHPEKMAEADLQTR